MQILFVTVLVVINAFLSYQMNLPIKETKKVLMVCTSVEKHPKVDNMGMGLWLGEATQFYEIMEKAGIEVDFCSPRGGYVPIDPLSLQEYNLPVDWKYYADLKFRNKLGTSLHPNEVKPEDYSAIYYAGGHGTMFDFPDNKKLQEISRKIYENNGIVSAVCQGNSALLNIKLSNGSYLISGKKVTSFSKEEEVVNNSTWYVPFFTEGELQKRGGIYVKAKKPFTKFVVADGRLVTGQNFLGGATVGIKVLAAMAQFSQ